jgi:hypothetical protein
LLPQIVRSNADGARNMFVMAMTLLTSCDRKKKSVENTIVNIFHQKKEGKKKHFYPF